MHKAEGFFPSVFFLAATLRRALNRNFLVNVMCIGQKIEIFSLLHQCAVL